jgi:hypothetical protein
VPHLRAAVSADGAFLFPPLRPSLRPPLPPTPLPPIRVPCEQTLLSQALKWQLHSGALPPGARLDVFRGAVPLRRDVEDRPTIAPAGAISFGSKAYPCAAAMTPDGSSIITASVDGIVEVYDVDTLKVRLDLPFQAADEFMMHDEAVTAAAVSSDGALLACGSRDGMVKVWRLATGECLRVSLCGGGGGGGGWLPVCTARLARFTQWHVAACRLRPRPLCG